MARRLPKPLIPLLVTVTAATLGLLTMGTSFAQESGPVQRPGTVERIAPTPSGPIIVPAEGPDPVRTDATLPPAADDDILPTTRPTDPPLPTIHAPHPPKPSNEPTPHGCIACG